MKWWQIRRRDADLERELQADLEIEEEEQRDRGVAPEEARYAARRALGNATLIREQAHEAWGWAPFERVWQDIRYALRQLRKSRGFTITSVLTLALGIGAVTSVFSVVDAVLLKPFAFPHPDRLVVMREVIDDPHTARSAGPVNYRHFLRLKKSATTLEDAAIFAQLGSSVSANGDHPRIVGTITASPNVFHVLGVEPILGRGFVEADAQKGANPVVVLSYAGWQTFFGGNPDVLGETLRIGGDPVTVIGVLPPWMRFPQIPLAPNNVFQESARDALLFRPAVPSDRDLSADMGNFNYKAIARLKPGVSLAQASAELESLQKAYSLSAHLPFQFGIALTPLTQDVASGISGALWLLFAAVAAVLLIACVNLASLQLARAVNAERETAVRAALGASKFQLVRSRLMESLLLSLAGGAAGTGLAFAGVKLCIAVVPASVPRLDEVRVSMPILIFAAGISIFAAIVFGMLPALRSLRVHPQGALQSNPARAANTREGSRTRNILVGTQVACTVVLLIITALALRSFSRLMRQNRGFDSSHITIAAVDLFAPRYGDLSKRASVEKLAFTDRTLAALRHLPGVQSAAITSVTPLTGETWVDNLFRPDHPVHAGQEPPINVRWIDPDYLPTMRTPLVAGRNFTSADRANPYVALISERTAREGFPGENPIGHKIVNLIPDNPTPITIVGVVANAHINGLKDDAAVVYVPYWAFTPWTVSFLVRSTQSSGDLIPEMRRAIWQIDPQVAIPTLKSMDDQVSESAATDRFQAVVMTSFGLAALSLALLGIYGTLAYSVSLRRQEFGIRIALGSGRQALMALVLRQAASPVFLGTSAGLAMAFLVRHWVRSLLYQTPLLDPLAIGGSVGLLLIAAAIAAIVPARRAASVNPMRVLRNE